MDVHVRACMQACSATWVRYGCGRACVHPWAAKRCAPCLTTSKIAAMRHACRTVSTPAPTEVPNALAMSLAPITKPSMIADPMPTATIHVLHVHAHPCEACIACEARVQRERNSTDEWPSMANMTVRTPQTLNRSKASVVHHAHGTEGSATHARSTRWHVASAR